MYIIPRVFVVLNVLLLARQTIQTIPERTLSETSDVERLAAEIIQSDQNSSILLDENGNLRDKRALGVLLQGLVQAFGYNATPVQLASFPNPNTVGTMAVGPVSIDVRQANPPVTTAAPRPILPPPPPPPPPPPTPRPPAVAPVPVPAASVPRQRETLRFTGVVNFGNNSDILGHLRQYERLFHGSISTTGKPPAPAPVPPPAPPAPPAINPRNAQRPPLLEPFFVPIPIPLSPNIQNLQNLQYPMTPLVSIMTPNSVTTVVTPVESTSPPTAVKQEYVSEEHKEIKTVKSEKTSSNKNPNFDERRNNHKKIVQNNKNREEKIVQKNQKAPVNLENSHEEDAGESHDDNLQKDGNTDAGEDNEEAAEIDPGEGSEDEGSKGSITEDQEGETEAEDTKKEQQADQSDSSENESDSEQEYNEEENVSEEEQSPSQKSSLNASKDTNESKKVSLEDAEDYIPRKLPNGYTIKLPVEDKPFNGPFMNSYGQSLEHAGRIDDSVADYFQRYKNAQSGLFDAQSIIAPQIQKRPLWIEGIPRYPIERIHNDYRQLLPIKFEGYNLDSNHNLNLINRKSPGADQRARVMNQISKTYKASPRDRTEGEESRLEDQEKLQKPDAGKSQKIQSEPLSLVPFEFTKYIPYYKPVQYFFSPESLQRSTQSILTPQNSQNYRNLPKTADARDTQDELENTSATAAVDKSTRIIRLPEKLTDRQLHQGQNEGVKHSKKDPARIIQQMGETAGRTQIIKDNPSTESPIRHHEDSDNSYERYSDESPEPNDANLNATDETPIPRYHHSGRSSSQEATDQNMEPKTAAPIRQSHNYEIIHRTPYTLQDSESVRDYSDEPGRQESAGKPYQSSEEASASKEDSPEERYVDEELKPTMRTIQIKYVPVYSEGPRGQLRYQESLPQKNYARNEPKPMDQPPVTSNLEDESEVRNPEEDLHHQGLSSDIKTIRNVPMKSYDPVTHGLPAKSIDDRRLLGPQGRMIRYRPEPSPSDEIRVNHQYASYSEPSALYSTYPNNGETMSSVGHSIFGQKIDPSLHVRRGEGRDLQKESMGSNKHMNSEILRTEMIRPIIREPIIVSESARGREFKSANKGYIVSDKSREEALKLRGSSSGYPRYH